MKLISQVVVNPKNNRESHRYGVILHEHDDDAFVAWLDEDGEVSFACELLPIAILAPSSEDISSCYQKILGTIFRQYQDFKENVSCNISEINKLIYYSHGESIYEDTLAENI